MDTDDQAVPAKKTRIQSVQEKSAIQNPRVSAPIDAEIVKESEAKEAFEEKPGA